MATPFVRLYDPVGAHLDADGLTALLFHSRETYSAWVARDAATGTLAQLRLTMHRLLQRAEPGVRARFISCGVEEERILSGVMLNRDATYQVPGETAGDPLEFQEAP
jgi:hypothetical protein